MKYLFTAIIALTILFSTRIYSQEEYIDVVFLLNGGMIKGYIIEQKIGISVKIKSLDGNIYVLKSDEIESIRRVNLTEYKPVNTETKNNYSYLNITRFGILSGEGSTFFTVSSVNGIHLGKNISLGIGIEYDDYPNNYILPIYFDLRGYIVQDKVSQFVFTDIGYSWRHKNSQVIDVSGFLFNGGIGFSFSNIMADISYRIQKSKITISNRFYDKDVEVTYNLFMISAGFIF